jgi:Zn-dependent protease with chaperone function
MSETIATCIYLHRTMRERWKRPAAVVAAVAVAEAAAMLLRPRTGPADPAPVNAESYFSAAEIERARAYRRPQLALYAGMLAVQGGVLGALVRRPPRLRPAASGAILAVSLSAAPLPLAAMARRRAMDVGLVTQPWRGWAGDVAKSLAIGAVEGAAAGAGAMALVGRLGGRWWPAGAAAGVGSAAAMTFAAPVVLAPLFHRFTDLPPGPARDDVLELAGRAGLKVGRVLEVDGSRRSPAANAYVTGLGATRRVVLYDTLIRDFARAETRLVVAHELAHVRHRDVQRGLLHLAMVAPFAAFATSTLAGPEPSLPALLAAAAVTAAPLGVVSNRLSRAIERRADADALATTGDSEAFVAFQRRIAVKNLADPDPPRWLQLLLGSHPSTVERIALAVATGRSPGGS